MNEISINGDREIIGQSAQVIRIDERGGKPTVNARELHKALGVGKDFSTWVKDRIDKYGFELGKDFERVEDLSSPDLGSAKARPQVLIEYFLSVPMAKELAMVENNDRGREVRRYFVKVEEAWNTPEVVIARGLQAAVELNKRLKAQIVELIPKAAVADRISTAEGLKPLRTFGEILHVGKNRIFKLAEAAGLIYKDHASGEWLPKADLDRYIVLREQPYERNGEWHTYSRLYVTGEGETWLTERLGLVEAHVPQLKG